MRASLQDVASALLPIVGPVPFEIAEVIGLNPVLMWVDGPASKTVRDTLNSSGYDDIAIQRWCLPDFAIPIVLAGTDLHSYDAPAQKHGPMDALTQTALALFVDKFGDEPRPEEEYHWLLPRIEAIARAALGEPQV